MDTIYYISGTLMTFTLIGLVVATIFLLVKPHHLQKSKHINKPVSRTAIVMVAFASLFLTMFTYGSVMAATEPASVKEARAAQAAAETNVRQAEEQRIKDAATQDHKRQEEAKKPVVKTETKTEVILFTSTQQEDGTLAKGQTRVATKGANGEKTITYDVTYVEGKETARKETKNEITTPAVIEVVQVGTYVYIAPPVQQSPPVSSYVAPPETHSNVRVGATCNDGTHSNATGSGACSHHKGVAFWLYG